MTETKTPAAPAAQIPIVAISVNGKERRIEKGTYTARTAKQAMLLPPDDQLFRAGADLEDVSKATDIAIDTDHHFFSYPRGADIRCPQPWLIDVNSRYQNAISVVASLAAGAMVFPIMFIRQVAGIPLGQPIGAFIGRWAFFGVGLLAVSIFSAVLYYYGSAKWMKIAWNERPDMFGKEKNDKDFWESFLDRTYGACMTGFVLGIGCMIAFVSGASDRASTPVVAAAPAPLWRFVGAVQNFAPGIPCTAQPAIGDQLASIRKRLLTAKPERILVVGSADISPPSRTAREFIGNDALLARLRAECIQTHLLSDSTLIGTGVDPAARIPTDFVDPSPIDRAVFVYATGVRH